MIRIICLFICIVLPVNVYAQGRTYSFEIEQVRIDKSGKGYVKFKTPLVAAPATCIRVGYENMLAFDTNTEGGKAVYSAMLAAFMAKKKVSATGSAQCTIFSNVVEDYNYGFITD